MTTTTHLSFQIENLHKLNTDEDSTFFHKFLGGICLLNFIYRFSLYFYNGNMNLNNNFSLFLIGTHGLLSVSSLIFRLSTVRNPSKPMIYPEFRLHSILFALRSVIICFQFYYKFHYSYQIVTCYITMGVADSITYFYNKEGKNGKTMRNMPFDINISMEKQKEITNMHSIMQIGATTYMLGDIQTAFSPLLAIQLAAFLMTLVRKSIINSTTWHAIYSITLWINLLLYETHSFGYIFIHQIMINTYNYIFFPLHINKYLAWTINFSLYIIYKECQVEIYFNDIYYPELCLFLKRLLLWYGFLHYFYKFRILFIN